MLFKGTDMKILPIAIVCLLKSTNSVHFRYLRHNIILLFTPGAGEENFTPGFQVQNFDNIFLAINLF